MSIKEQIGAINGKVERTRELIMGPRVIEFENGITLETSIRSEKPDIKLKRGEEVLEDFNALIPNDVEIEFNPGGKWRVERNSEGALVLYVGKFKDVDAVLSFLHEVGHLENIEDADLVNRVRQLSYDEAKRDTLNAYPNSRIRALAEEKKWVIKSERDAWGFALRKTRELEKRFGLTIFNRLPGGDKVWKNVMEFVNHYLETYERSYVEEAYNFDIFKKEEMEEVFERLLSESNEVPAN